MCPPAVFEKVIILGKGLLGTGRANVPVLNAYVLHFRNDVLHDESSWHVLCEDEEFHVGNYLELREGYLDPSGPIGNALFSYVLKNNWHRRVYRSLEPELGTVCRIL